MKFTRSAVAALTLAGTLGACDNGLTDLNENPNAPTEVAAQFILPEAIQSSVGRILGANFHMTLTALWVQHLAKIQYIDEDRYELRDATVQAHWNGLYAGPLADFQEIIRQGKESNRPNVEAVGLIMKSWAFGVMTDLWGDIPYSEALQGNATPKYDPQEQIYEGILRDLKAASDMIRTSGGGGFAGGDLLYGNDMAKWQKFANSLRMRHAMRMSEVAPAKARAEFIAAYQAGGFTSNADNAQLVYSTGAPNQNPIFVNFQTRFDHVISATMVDTLKSFNDPRLMIYATEAPEPDPAFGPYRGMRNGLSDDHPVKLASLSRLGTYFRQADAPAVVMSYAEVLFLQAEAAQRGWIAGNAADLYRRAIMASMAQYGVSEAAAAAYLARPRVAYNPATGIEQIALQKWIALFGNGPEAYSEWRRLDIPRLTAAAQGANAGKIPVRVPYPNLEQSYNKANLMAVGIKTFNDRVWWDKQ